MIGKVQPRKLAIEFLRSRVVHTGRFLQRVEVAQRPLLALGVDASAPPLPVEADSLEPTHAVSMRRRVVPILKVRSKAQVRLAAIQLVAVDVVNLHVIGSVHQKAMQKGSALPKNLDGVSGLGALPRRHSEHSLGVLRVNLRKLATGKGNEDTLVMHGDLQSLCRAGGVRSTARHFRTSELYPLDELKKAGFA